MNSSGNNPTLDVVLLTAGESKRLGQPKQHVVLSSSSLLQRAVDLACNLLDALRSSRQPIIISGAYLPQDCRALVNLTGSCELNHHYNGQWMHGMETSLDCARPVATADGVLVLLVDQYAITLDGLLALHTKWLNHPQRSVAASYADTIGPPVIWPQALWQGSRDDKPSGLATNKARLLASDPVRYAMPEASADLDTCDDLNNAIMSSSHTP